MSFILIATTAFLASALTLFSGFGLGTILLPVFALFMPVSVAVGATAVVHGANSLLKAVVLGHKAEPQLVVRFGIPAVLAAFAGAALLGVVSAWDSLLEYQIGTRTATVTPIKLLVGLLMFGFGVFELLPRFRQLHFDRRYLLVGGLLSGFFGGLSGHQGALRSAFLVKSGVTTESFVGTNAVLALLVDVSRLVVYGFWVFGGELSIRASDHSIALIATGVIAAFAGILIGRRYVKKITISAVQILTASMLMAISLTLISGLV